MKKVILSSVFMMAACMGAGAMSLERAQAEALYLTDKMAYELNLNEQQYNDAYEINLDYFLRVDSPGDVYGDYYSYRLNDLRCILHDWQYSLLTAADYFLRPIVWRAGGWFFPIYSYYNRSYFYYGRPSVWRTYYGGHSRFYHRGGFYVDRRPPWDGGLRGRDMHRPSYGAHHSSPASHRPSSGFHRPSSESSGFHRPSSGSSGSHHPSSGSSNFHRPSSGMSGHSGGSHGNVGHGSMRRGNSFDGSSSRMSGNSRGGRNFGGGRGGRR